MTLDHHYQPVRTELEQVRADMSRYWHDAIDLIAEPSQRLPRLGGKLLRPALCLLAAGAAGAHDLRPFVPLAGALELLHLAALTHDDIVDQAELRRGGASINAVWDNHIAVLCGDYFVARAIELLAQSGSRALIAATFEAVRRMTEGELQNARHPPRRPSESDCLRLAEQKTAAYFSITCTAPTYIHKNTYRHCLNAYGMALGVAFQLVDDLLDICQDETVLGKPACGDLADGKETLPILYMREHMAPEDDARLAGMLGRPLSARERAWVARRLVESGARQRTENLARTYVDAARAALAPLPPSVYKDAMLGLAEFVLVRES